MEAVDVLRPLALRQRRLRPGELEIVLRGRALPGWPPRRPASPPAGPRLLASDAQLRRRYGSSRDPTSRGCDRPSRSDRDHLEADPHVAGCGLRVSQTCAARRTRRRFSASTAPTAPPKPLPRRSFTSTNVSLRPAPDDQVELVAAGLDVRAEDPVAAQAVVPERAPLARVHAAAGSARLARSTWPRTRAGAARTGRARAPPPSAPGVM